MGHSPLAAQVLESRGAALLLPGRNGFVVVVALFWAVFIKSICARNQWTAIW